jgi:hypothetical protein
MLLFSCYSFIKRIICNPNRFLFNCSKLQQPYTCLDSFCCHPKSIYSPERLQYVKLKFVHELLKWCNIGQYLLTKMLRFDTHLSHITSSANLQKNILYYAATMYDGLLYYFGFLNEMQITQV